MNYLLDFLQSFTHILPMSILLFLPYFIPYFLHYYLVHSYIAIETNINTQFQTFEKIFLKSFSLLKIPSLLNIETYQLPLKSLTLGANGCCQVEGTSPVLETLGIGLEEI